MRSFQFILGAGLFASTVSFAKTFPSPPDLSQMNDVVMTENKRFVSYRDMATKNISIVDFDNPIRSQGAIGSCQSFAFLGMIENSLYQKAGVTVDLSERYQLFANYMEFGQIGAEVPQIITFPKMIFQYGVLPEAIYPYSEVDKNSEVFAVDSAQGLTAAEIPAIDLAVKEKTSAERFEILQENRFFGALPNGKAEVSLPVQALKIDENSAQRIVLDLQTGHSTSCFAVETTNTQIKVSSADFARLCLDFDPNDFTSIYASQKIDDPKSRPEYCKSSESRKAISQELYETNSRTLFDLLRGLIAKQSSLIGFSVPEDIEARKSVLWRAKDMRTVAGHATLAVGFLTAQDLKLPENHTQGLLGSGLFDDLAKTLDPSYVIPSASSSLQEKMATRLNSKLGIAISEEQGILIFRNSWGDIPGKQGYQAMTFDYYLKYHMLSIWKKMLPEQKPFNISIQIPKNISENESEFVTSQCAQLKSR